MRVDLTDPVDLKIKGILREAANNIDPMLTNTEMFGSTQYMGFQILCQRAYVGYL